MLMSIATSRLPWLAGLAMVLGTVCALFGRDVVAASLIGAGVAWGTTVSKDKE